MAFLALHPEGEGGDEGEAEDEEGDDGGVVDVAWV